MSITAINQSTNHNQTSWLWFLTLSYTMTLIFANWFAPRLIAIFGIATDAGTLIFPFTFLLSNLITEIYGYKFARRAIWCGFLFNGMFVLYAQLIVHMPGPDFASNNALFDQLLAFNSRIIIASCISYLTAEPLNNAIVAKLKVKMNGEHLWFRFLTSSITASCLDTIIFVTISFYGVISNQHLVSLIFAMWMIKAGIEVLGLPLSLILTRKLKAIEKLDVYDRNTRFNLFSLDTGYTARENEF